MKITLESTDQMVWIEYGPGDQQAFLGRVWEGTTEAGVYVQAVITRIAAPSQDNLAEFERDLTATAPPKPTVQVFPLRMII